MPSVVYMHGAHVGTSAYAVCYTTMEYYDILQLFICIIDILDPCKTKLNKDVPYLIQY